MAEALQPLHRALRSQTQGNAHRSAASTPPQSPPATPQLNPPPRGAWQNQQPRNVHGFRGGNTIQSGGSRGGFFQPQGRNNGNNEPQTPPNSPRNQQQFQQRSVTPTVTNRLRRGPGCFVCGDRRCHTEVHRRNGTLPPAYRRPPPAWNNERNRRTAFGLNDNARVFTPSSNSQRQSSSGNSGGNPGSGNQVPPLQRPSSA